MTEPSTKPQSTSHSEKLAVVTGGTSGLGLSTTLHLLRSGAQVIFTARNSKRGEEALQLISAEVGMKHRASYMILDNEDLVSVQAFAREFLEKHDSLDILVNNAGIAFVEWRLTDGIESQVMVNHLSHFLLTQLLLPTLDKTARIKGDARIVNVSSPAHASLYFCKFLPSNPKAVDWDAMCTPVTADPLENYGLSKLAQIHQVVELQRRLGEDSKVRINSCEPGFVRSAMATKPKANYIGWLLGLFLYFFGTHPDKAAKTQVYLALSPEIRDSDVSGRHFISPGTQKRPSALASDPDAALATWQWSESTAASILKRREAA